MQICQRLGSLAGPAQWGRLRRQPTLCRSLSAHRRKGIDGPTIPFPMPLFSRLLHPAEQVAVRWSQIWAVRCVIDALVFAMLPLPVRLREVWHCSRGLSVPEIADHLHTFTRNVQLSCKRFLKYCHSFWLTDHLHACATVRRGEGAFAAGGVTHQVRHGQPVALPASEVRFAQRRTEPTSIPTVLTVNCF